MSRNGFTLMEVMVSATLIVIVSVCGFVALQSSTRTTTVNQTTSLLQADARNLMLALSREFEIAIKPAPTGFTLPSGVQGLCVQDNNRRVVFQTPLDGAFTQFSPPITIQFETEDTPVERPGFEFGNALLDHGEDSNGDGVLNRRVTLTRDGETRVLGGANTIADVRFELLENDAALRISIVATAPIENVADRLATYELQSEIYVMN